MTTKKIYQLVSISFILLFVSGIAAADVYPGLVEALTDDDVDHLNLVVSNGNAVWQSCCS
ncbi:MAG: hypothetical protein ACYTET_04605 [Planctomycetota bacterium]|jgi:hypothetical protein